MVCYSHLFKIFPQIVRTVIRLILQMRKRKHRRLNNLLKTALRRDHTPCPWAGLQTRLLSKSLNPGTGKRVEPGVWGHRFPLPWALDVAFPA